MELLIIDDEAIIREWLQFTLASMHIEDLQVDTATDGVHGLELMAKKSYDIVFLDIQMPRMNGIEFLRQIHQQHPTALPVILSSHNQFDYAREAMRLGAFEYVLKSECTKETLGQLVHRCIDHQKASRNASIHNDERPCQSQSSDHIFYHVPPDGFQILSENDPQMEAFHATTRDVLHSIRTYDNGRIFQQFEDMFSWVHQSHPPVQLVKTTCQDLAHALYLYYCKDAVVLQNAWPQMKQQIQSAPTFVALKAYCNKIVQQAILSQRQAQDCSAHVTSALTFIATHYSAIETVGEIAHAIHLNTDYLTRLFKKEMGVSINTYLVDYRLDMASYMLKSTNLQISDIACNVGIPNISYFSKKFKERYKMQPGSYRISQLKTSHNQP